jgi:hypothetical protein
LPTTDPISAGEGARVQMGSNVESVAVIAALEVEMSPHDPPKTTRRPPSDAENAMAANARSRDRQGKAEDKARRDGHSGMKRDGPVREPPAKSKA